MFQISKYEIRLWTMMGLLHTAWEIIRTNEGDILSMWDSIKDIREYKHFSFFCNFCTIRLYLLAYIALVYPVYVGKNKMLITPWLVISGLRILAPNAVFRIYFWILIFRYWMYLVDKEILECLRDATSEKKKKYLQRLDKDEEALIKETRRRIKGIRCHIARKKLCELSEKSLTLSSIHLEINFEGNSLSRNENYPETRLVSSDVGLISGEYAYRDSFNVENEFYKMYNHTWRISKIDKNNPIRVTDCILQQLTDLIQKLVSKPKEQLLKDSEETDNEMESNKFSKYQNVLYLPHSENIIIRPLKYSKPSYIINYPGIFAKNSNKMSNRYNQGSVTNKFGRMLMKTSNTDDTLRETFEEFYGRP